MKFGIVVSVLNPVLFIMVFAWFVMVKKLFNRLERLHPVKYEAMGKPSLFLNNNISGNIALFRFLFRQEHLELCDKNLSKLSRLMVAFFITYLILFTILVAVFLSQAQWQGAA